MKKTFLLVLPVILLASALLGCSNNTDDSELDDLHERISELESQLESQSGIGTVA
jgi:hypothetical protein